MPTPLTWRHLVALFAIAAALMAVFGGSVARAAVPPITDFESFTLGDVNGQNGWTSGHGSSSCPVYDVGVVSNTDVYPSLGSKSLRISNAITCGSYNDQTFSKSLVNEAGETSASTSTYSGGTRQPYFQAQWDFASTVPGSEQPGLSVVASPDRGDPSRMSWLQMQDTPTGLQLNFDDYQHYYQGEERKDFVLTPIATGLDRTVPHTVKMTMNFIDGAGNDVVKVYVDGVLKHTGTSWEDYYRDWAGGVPHPVDSMLFRVAGTAVPETSGKGFLIDNFSSFSGAVPSADLTGLSLSSGTLSPAFSSSTTAFTANVDNGTTSVDVSTSTNPGASAVVTGGSNLAVGSNTVTITVTAADGTTKTYTVTVTRAASNNADLTSLSLSSGTLSPAFDPSTTAYTASVDNIVTNVSVTKTTNPGAGAVVSGGSSLAVGTNTVSVTVTSADLSATNTYTITVTRAGAAPPPPGVSTAIFGTPTSAPPPPGVSTAIFGTPISATTTSGAPTTLTASVSGASATVSVPAGALPSGTTVSIYPVTDAAALKSKVPPGQSYVVSFAVSWQAPDGSSPTASAPITMTITDPGIHAGDTVYEVTSSGLKAVGIATTNGVATITFTNDPTFIVAAPPKLVRAWIVGRVVRSSVQMRLGCKAGPPCRGTAKLSVRRKHKHGKKTIVTRVTVATAHFSLAAGKTTNVAFHITASGRAILLARHMPTRWLSMLLKTTVTGASRSVPQRAFVLVPGRPSRPAR